LSLVAPSQAPPRPSGLVPGLGWSGCVRRLLIAGGIQALDCVSAVFLRVFFGKLQDLFVILHLSEVLLVIVHPPPK
jgi:hypothetical protein